MQLADVFNRNKKRLEEEKETIEKEIKRIDEQNKSDQNEGRSEQELETMAEEAEISAVNKSQRKTLAMYLRQIRIALKKMRDKDYGKCSNCGKAIPIARLSIDPTAIYCLDCASKMETLDENKD